ncbi:hypothetical protein [Nonomuraea fuscirosea]|uniref:hypothetical protein n=1 Tax=Nonomuraea fuscirosea TaxID=1291556 RepID=UPI003412D433
MKTRMLAAALGIAALSGLLVPSPAQAADEVAYAYLPPIREDIGGGSVRATIGFASQKKIVVRNFTVRDICPGDNAPVKAQVVWVHRDGTRGSSRWRTDSNGCGTHGTNFGTIARTSHKRIKYAYLSLRVYDREGRIAGVQISYRVNNGWN